MAAASGCQEPYRPSAAAVATGIVRHLKTSPVMGPPARTREVDLISKRWVHAPGGASSMVPSQTSSPSAIRVPSVSKHLSTAAAGLLAATPASGFALMLVIQSWRTAKASIVSSL
jgi:hypothetical protein